MDIVDRIIDLSAKDISMFISNSLNDIYIRIIDQEELMDLIKRLDKMYHIRGEELNIVNLCSITEDVDYNDLVYPMYIKIEKYISLLGIVLIDDRLIVKEIEDNSSRYNIYKGESILYGYK